MGHLRIVANSMTREGEDSVVLILLQKFVMLTFLTGTQVFSLLEKCEPTQSLRIAAVLFGGAQVLTLSSLPGFSVDPSALEAQILHLLSSFYHWSLGLLSADPSFRLT